MIHEFKINNRSLLAMSMSEDSVNHEVLKDGITFYTKGPVFHALPLPDGNYKLIGLYPGMSEEQAAGIVENISSFGKHGIYKYRNYQDRPDVLLRSALESFASKMAAEKLYIINPIEDPGVKGPDPYRYVDEPDLYDRAFNNWQDAELRTSKAWCIIERLK